jgi:hypothetical protein
MSVEVKEEFGENIYSHYYFENILIKPVLYNCILIQGTSEIEFYLL